MTARDPTTILLARHGETDWNREGRLQGWAPVGLNDRGRRQARRLGKHVAGSYDVDRLLASDLQRTRETTALVREAGVDTVESETPRGDGTTRGDSVDADLEFDPAWRERDLGIYQGLTREEMDEQFPAFALESGLLALEECPEGGECLVDAYERTVAAWERLRADPGGDTVLVVTHGGPVTGVLAHVRGDDLFTAIAEYAIGNCTLAELRVWSDETVAVRRVEGGPPAIEE